MKTTTPEAESFAAELALLNRSAMYSVPLIAASARWNDSASAGTKENARRITAGLPDDATPQEVIGRDRVLAKGADEPATHAVGRRPRVVAETGSSIESEESFTETRVAIAESAALRLSECPAIRNGRCEPIMLNAPSSARLLPLAGVWLLVIASQTG